jgi:ubiquinone/menaquinone biosynthesis C-methylase UbiE
VLDVYCGTSYLLRSLAGLCSDADELAGIDPAPAMIEVATASAHDDRLNFSVGVAEQVPGGGALGNTRTVSCRPW